MIASLIRYSGGGDEGLEVGVTTTKPEDIELATRGYAASVSPSWFSSDSGSLWINGHPLYHHGQWQQTRPTALKAGDVVTVQIKASGHFEIYCNGLFQTCWAAAQVPTDRPLYPVFGLRAPACAIATRLRDAKLDGLPKGRRALTLRGIEGRLGELIDLSKHGRPRYPATFLNVRSLTDIQSLAPLLYAPWAKREQGCKGAQPILIRAGPGTGKTWCIMQLLYLLALGQHALSPPARRKVWRSQGWPTRARYLAHGRSEHCTKLELVPYALDAPNAVCPWLLLASLGCHGWPLIGTVSSSLRYVIYVQKLARLMRQAKPTPTKADDLVRFYMRAEHAEGVFGDVSGAGGGGASGGGGGAEAQDRASDETLALLEQLLEMRALILLLDGVDEAADLKEVIEDYVCTELVPAGHPIVVTSRPEGVRLRLYKRNFVIMNLEPLSKEQQQAAIRMQLEESAFFNHLSQFSEIRQMHDKLYVTSAFPREADRLALEARKLPDRFLLDETPDAGCDPEIDR